MSFNNFIRILDSSFFLAWKSLSKNKKKVALTLLIISMGFISSIIIFGVLQDVSYKLEENFIDVSFGHVMIEPLDDKDQIENVDNLLKKINSLSEVVGSTAIQKKIANIYDSDGKHISGEVIIIEPDSFYESTIINDLLEQGELIYEMDTDVFLTGSSNLREYALLEDFNTIDLSIGDSATFYSSNGKASELKLKGFYQHSFYQLDVLSYITQSTASEIFSDYNSEVADMIIIRLEDREQTEQVISELSYLGVKGKILGWDEKATLFSSTVSSFEIIGELSFLIGVLVAIVSVYIILYINILTRKVQIGIMKAIGLDEKIITLDYIIQAFFYGFFGSLLGIIFTYLVIIYFNLNPIYTAMGALAPIASIKIFLIVSLTVILSSTLAGWFVARKIIKQNILNLVLKR